MAIITVSRGTFSGGRSLAESVAERLGYRCLPRVALYETANRYGVSEEKLSKAISEAPHLLEHLSSDRARYLACARAALLNEVKGDNVVYHGLAGHFLLKGVSHVLRVRVIANMEFRIKAAMDRSHLTREDAIQVLRTMDDKRARWTRFLYHVDWGDPSSYDLVINLDQISLDSACEIVCSTVSLDEFKTTPEWRITVDDLVLSTEVRAAIAANAASKNIADAGIEIEADKGVVTIGGTVASLGDADKIREIVRTIPGVNEIDSKMRVHAPW
ncbi:cytidylate kinase family protein [Chloroflexota bacterium]